MRLYIGLMSGTSMDGIDAALMDVETHALMAGITYPYQPETKRKIIRLSEEKSIMLSDLYSLHYQIGNEFANAANEVLKKAKVKAEEVIAIGSHGQTLAHDMRAIPPYTVQLACPHTIAQKTGITVVADFRTRDVIMGGQGAPLAPIYHQAVFAKPQETLAIVNIGGIANVTFLEGTHKVTGYDTGPGNCLMDSWIQQHHGSAYDTQGEWAGSGEAIDALLTSCLADPYFLQSSPKSIGKEYFSLHWLAHYLKPSYRPQDVQATLLLLTTKAIVQAIKQYPSLIHQLIVCGGGCHNIKLIEALSKELPRVSVSSSALFGINPDYLEAMMFAWLADKTLHKTSLDLRGITGGPDPSVLGLVVFK